MGKILVVDDDPELSEVVGLLLREAGHETEIACSAEQALALAKTLQPELVLADWNMPGGGADELRVRFAAEGIGATVIVMTGMTAIEIPAPEGAGFAAVLPKPFDVERLLELVSLWTGPSSRAPAQP